MTKQNFFCEELFGRYDKILLQTSRAAHGQRSRMWDLDMVLTEEQELFDTKKPNKTRSKRAAIRSQSNIWPKGIIPYQFSSKGEFSVADKNEINAAMR